MLADTLKPFSYAKSFMFKRKLMKMTEKRLFYHYGNSAYSNLKTNTIYLPFVEPLDLDDLKTLLQHEEGHFIYTQTPAEIPLSYNLSKAQTVLNYLDDIIINEHIPEVKLRKVFKKLGKTDMQLTLWQHLNDDKKIEVIKALQKSKIIKDSYTPEDAKNIIEKTVDVRKKYSNVRDFVYHERSVFDEFYNLFTDEGILQEIGDGPAEYNSHYNLPDWNLVKEFTKLIKNFKTISSETFKEEKIIGKRINRKFFEDVCCYKPFIIKKDVVSIRKPRIVMLLDCSGSMRDTPERLAKSFIVAVLNNLNSILVAHNEYFTNVVTNSNTAIKIPMTGDEHFDKLDPKKYSCDIFITITDLEISNSEALGLKRFAKTINAKRKYLLCVNRKNLYNHKMLDDVYNKRVLINDGENFLKFVKSLCREY